MARATISCPFLSRTFVIIMDQQANAASEKSKKLIETLLGMGFSEKEIEAAVAAGNDSVDLLLDWISSKQDQTNVQGARQETSLNSLIEIIKTNNNKNDLKEVSRLLIKVLGNVVSEPQNTKYHSLIMGNAVQKLLSARGVLELLSFCGFVLTPTGLSLNFTEQTVKLFSTILPLLEFQQNSEISPGIIEQNGILIKSGRVIGFSSKKNGIIDGTMIPTNFDGKSNLILVIDSRLETPPVPLIKDVVESLNMKKSVGDKLEIFFANSASVAYKIMRGRPWQCWSIFLCGNCAEEFTRTWFPELTDGCFTTAVTLYVREQSEMEFVKRFKNTHDSLRHSEIFVFDGKSGDPLNSIFTMISKYVYQRVLELVFLEKTKKYPISKNNSKVSVGQRFSGTLTRFKSSMHNDLGQNIITWNFIGRNYDRNQVNIENLESLFEIAHKWGFPESEIKVLLPLFLPSPFLYPFFTSFKFLIRAYTSETFFYKTLNECLSMNDMRYASLFRSFITASIRLLQSKKCSYYSGTVFRGIKVPDPESTIREYCIGDDIYFHVFMSTSKSLEVAKSFNPNIIFKIKTASANYQEENTWGYTNMDLSEISVFPNEQEVLYPPLTTFKVEGISKENHVTYIELTESTGSVLWIMLEMALGIQF